MYLADYHVHSSCSPDGRLTMADMARQGIARGLDEICFTDHVDTIEWGTTCAATAMTGKRPGSSTRTRWGSTVTASG